MDLNSTLTKITIGGLVLTFIGSICSQVWKDSIEVQDRIKKRLTPAGWLLLGLALVGLSGSVASELMRVNILHAQEAQAQSEAAHKRDLENQESRFRADTIQLLRETEGRIDENLKSTINGFKDEQEESGRQTNKIILSGQPLTSLSIRWRFSSADSALWKIMEQGQKAIKQNSDEEQGGSPETPYDIEEYNQALLPLMSYIAHIGHAGKASKAYERRRIHYSDSDSNATRSSIVALMPLDSSRNTVLSFGEIDNRSGWYEAGKGTKLSSGFAPVVTDTRKGNSTPHVTAELPKDLPGGVARYTIKWDLDPVTLDHAADRTNPLIAPTANLPGTLVIAVLYDMDQLPFEQNNFAVSYADNLWINDDSERTYIIPGHDLFNVDITMELNGFKEKKYKYVLKHIYKLTLTNDADLNPDMGVGCTVLEFAAS